VPEPAAYPKEISMRTRALAVAVLVAAVGVLAAGCGDDGPRRPPLTLPTADRFADGACADAAGPVLALGRFTYDRDGAAALPAADYPFLREQSEKLAAVRNRAEPPVRDRVTAVLSSIGFIRVRPGKAYDPQLVRDLEVARADLQKTCLRPT
jgi:predicted small lipoprotein YifL